MDKKLIVTVVDGNSVNQNSLKILLKGIIVLSQSSINNIIVLYPEGEVSTDFLNWLELYQIPSYSRQLLDKHDDPYRAKFLLSEIIRDRGKYYDEIFYLDPDHLILRMPELNALPDTLIVSSEVKPLESRVIQTLSSKSLLEPIISNHYNTSIIYGRYTGERQS